MAKERLDIIISAKDMASKTIKGVTGALGGMGRLAGSLAKIGAIGLGATAAAVGGLTVAVGKLAEQGAQLEGVQKAFEGFTGTQAGSLLSAMKEASNGMITQTDLMKNYNTAAQLVGKQFADTLPDALNYLGKVAAATGQDMNYMMTSLVTGIGRESKMILDNLGIVMPEMDELLQAEAKRLGIAEEEFKDWADGLDNATRKMILTNKVMELLNQNTANLPEVVNPVKQITTAFKDWGDEAKKAIHKAVLPFLEKIAPVVKEILDVFVEFVFKKNPAEELQKRLRALPQPIQTFLKIAREGFRLFELLLRKGPMAVIDQIGWLIQRHLGQKAYQTFLKIREGMTNAFDWIRDKLLPWLGDKIPKAIDFLSEKWSQLREWFKRIKEGYDEYLKEPLNNLWNSILKIFGFEGQGKIGGFQEKLDKFVEWLSTEGMKGLGAFTQWLADELPVAVEEAKKKLNELKSTLGPLFDEIKAAIFGDEETGKDDMFTVWSGNLENFRIIWEDNFAGIKDFFMGWKESLLGLWNTLVATLQGDWDAAWNGIKQAVRGSTQIISGLLKGLVTIIAGPEVGGRLEKTLDSWGQWFYHWANKIAGHINTVLEKMDQLGTATGLFDIPDSFYKTATETWHPPLIYPTQTPSPFSGVTGGATGESITVVYSPTFSAASRQEFEQVLIPLIDRAQTNTQRRRVERR